ncbi:hypothetical protein [Kineococcus sp. R86509]|uniref:hypothetical protein n=1 Tax=Kineococcus sp. R86509 TaxID=3093851 RepID=UPI0036D41D3E
MIKRLDERLGDDFDVEAQLRQDLHTRPAPALAFDVGRVKQRGLRRRRRAQILPAAVLAVVVLGGGAAVVGTGAFSGVGRGGVVSVAPADASAASAQQVVRSAIELNEQGLNMQAAEQFWYPGYADTADFTTEKLQITDLVIGMPTADSGENLSGQWEHTVAVPVSWTHVQASGSAAAGPWSGSFVLVRHADTDPWRIASVESSAAQR